MDILNHEQVKDFIEYQLSCWDLAKKNYDALIDVRRRFVEVDNMMVGIQWNPGRAKSTGAKIDKDSIAKRKCFLCRANRPEEQLIYPILPGWEMLVNPYPIFPVHLTIAASGHRPQDAVPDDIVKLAVSLPGIAVFFNGAHAGASAPDHMHLQGVLKDEIPLIKLVEKYHPVNEPGIKFPCDFGMKLPFFFISGVVPDDDSGIPILAAGLKSGGKACDGTLSDPTLVNVFFWLSEEGVLRFISIPRQAHRPSCFFATGKDNRMVSPGCVDMGGLLIVPREEDFNNLTSSEITRIYSEVAVSNAILGDS